jgi:hypothetical protein
MNTLKAFCFQAALLLACVPLALAQGTYMPVDVRGAIYVSNNIFRSVWYLEAVVQ